MFMKKRIVIAILSITLCLSITACSNNGSSQTKSAESKTQDDESLSSVEKIQEAISLDFKDAQVSEGIVMDGSVLYVTVGEDEDPEKLGNLIEEFVNEPWFNYDYILFSQYVDNYFAVSTLMKCDDYQVNYHIWFDNDGKILGDYSEGSENGNVETAALTETVTQETQASETEPSVSSVPSIEQTNALNRAKRYLNSSAFSYNGLIEQLEYEGYSNESAVYAVDNCGADWNEQAAKKARRYLDTTSFSRSGLIDQLLYEGFTQEQAEYGVTAVGY